MAYAPVTAFPFLSSPGCRFYIPSRPLRSLSFQPSTGAGCLGFGSYHAKPPSISGKLTSALKRSYYVAYFG